jgi:putative DNA primase/helicase
LDHLIKFAYLPIESASRKLLIIFHIRFPFRRVFRGATVDKNLIDKLLEELSGIFNFAIHGLKRLVENEFDFSHVEKINNAILGYKSEQNPLCR